MSKTRMEPVSKTPAGGGSSPALWPSRLERLAARALPAGAARDRYRAEFLAELCGMTRRQQTRHAIGVLSHAWALRMAVASQGQLAGGIEVIKTRTDTRPLLCRLNLYHVWRWHSTDDGSRYRRCVLCDKDDHRTRGPMDQNGFGVGVSDIWGY
jgi:hypothetical protein